MPNHTDFPLNRWDFSALMEEIRQMETIPDTLTDKETGIDIYQGDKIDKAALIDILQHFNEMDNLAQLDAKQCYEKSIYDVRDFQFVPYWIKVTKDKVTVDYVGETVNTEFCMTFRNIDGQWQIG